MAQRDKVHKTAAEQAQTAMKIRDDINAYGENFPPLDVALGALAAGIDALFLAYPRATKAGVMTLLSQSYDCIVKDRAEG